MIICCGLYRGPSITFILSILCFRLHVLVSALVSITSAVKDSSLVPRLHSPNFSFLHQESKGGEPGIKAIFLHIRISEDMDHSMGTAT